MQCKYAMQYASSIKHYFFVVTFLNGVQFLNATFVVALPLTTVIYPVTRINASE